MYDHCEQKTSGPSTTEHKPCRNQENIDDSDIENKLVPKYELLGSNVPMENMKNIDKTMNKQNENNASK